MKKYICMLLLSISGPIFGETYLCIPEAGAGVSHGGDDGIRAYVYDISNIKFVQTNESGKWVVKVIGEDSPLFDNCTSQHVCERKGEYAGSFIRDMEGIFVSNWFSVDGEERVAFIAKGRCTKL
jgi:hypothetical protein